MRMPPVALCVTLLLLLSPVAQAPFVAPAAAQTQTKAQPQSREALYLKCRKAIFRKYGSPAQYIVSARGTLCCHTRPAAGSISASPTAAASTEAPAAMGSPDHVAFELDARHEREPAALVHIGAHDAR